MVAAEAVMEKRESESRVKAAAWAWYQRSGGSVTPSAGRSEVFAVRCALRRSTSRFQREAASRLRVTLASAMSDSALTSFSSLDNSSSLSQYTANFGDVDATDPDESSSLDRLPSLDQILSSDDCDADQCSSSLDLVALHPMACWDCGSSLFDTFELVAMSKKLDAELHEPNIDSEAGPGQDLHPASSLGLAVDNHKGLKQQQVLYLQDKPYNSVSPPSLADDYDAYNTDDAYDKLMSVPDKQSKQAVYDMFCRYGNVSKHVAKQANKRSLVDTPCGEECRKHKPRHGRMSLHGIAKALLQIRHPSSQLSSGVDISQDHHHHHHPPHSPHRQQGKALSNGVHKGVSRLGDRFLYDDAIDKGQRKERHIHHHHHHHYHYLFHSDDDFQLQSLDKSLMVAAAGLRSPKVNPALSSYLESPARAELGMDYGRKWADLGSIPPPAAGCNF